MKKLILIAIVIFGCKNKREIYQEKFYAYSDSISAYYDKGMCYIKCNNIYSFSYANKMMHIYRDSENVYYALMYPNGNPADKEDEAKTTNCNCK